MARRTVLTGVACPATQMTQRQSVEAANADFAAAFKDGGKAIPPARAAAIVTCMDARLHPEKFLGADIGGEVFESSLFQRCWHAEPITAQ